MTARELGDALCVFSGVILAGLSWQAGMGVAGSVCALVLGGGLGLWVRRWVP